MSWLSSLLGQDSQHQAGVAQNNANNQLQLQNQYGIQASGQYGQLASQGSQGSQAYNANYLPLLQNYGQLAGLGSAGNLSMPQVGNQGTGRIPDGTDSATGQQSGANNPYSLDINQTGRLNQINAGIARSQQTATSQFTQAMQQKGITDPRALQVGQQQIAEHFAALHQTQMTDYYNQIKDDKLKALQQLISGVGQYGNTGIQQQEAAGSGYLGLATGAGNAAQQQQSQAFQQQQLASQQLAGLLKLGGYAASGGFAGAPTSGVGGTALPNSPNYIDTSQLGG